MKSQTINQVMTPAPYSVRHDHSLAVAAKLMQDKHIRHLPVLEGKRVVGVLAERDVKLAQAQPNARTATVAQAELSEPVVVAPTDPLAEVVAKMAARRAEIAVVFDKERIVGVFTTIDALKLMAQLLASP